MNENINKYKDLLEKTNNFLENLCGEIFFKVHDEKLCKDLIDNITNNNNYLLNEVEKLNTHNQLTQEEVEELRREKIESDVDWDEINERQEYEREIAKERSYMYDRI